MDALVKKLMKPSLAPVRSWKASLRRRRSSMTALMSTSLKVVSIAEFCCDSTSRCAMVSLRRERRTRSSRPSSAAGGASCLPSSSGAAGRSASRVGAPLLCSRIRRSTSSRVTLPVAVCLLIGGLLRLGFGLLGLRLLLLGLFGFFLFGFLVGGGFAAIAFSDGPDHLSDAHGLALALGYGLEDAVLLGLDLEVDLVR